MRLDSEILDGPPEAGARIVALARLAEAEDAFAALAEPRAADALRGFRRALRRLRATLRALAPALAGALPAEHLACLGAVLRRTAPLRDAEVVGGWLQAIRGELAGPYRGALDWLADRVERRRQDAEEEQAEVVARRFRRLAPRLHHDLATRRAASARPGAPATFAAMLGAALRAQTRALREAILAAAGPGDAAGLERARVEARRLADLLETLRGSEVDEAAAAAALHGLEELLRERREAYAAETTLEGALLDARAEEIRRGATAIAGLRPGLLAILRLAQKRGADLAARIAAEHLDLKATPLTDAAYAVVAALEGRGGDEDAKEAGPPAAPERRFLVTAIPPEGRGGDVEELEQGWLPGDGRESVGVTRSPLGEQWFRARAPAPGRPGRVENVSRSEFEAFWPLTEGLRIAKRRHLVTAAPGWHFDEYLDRPLVLAVAEEGNVEDPLPWLEPVLVREVSEERRYLDEALARRPARRAG